MLTESEIKEIRDRCNKAYPGPWDWQDSSGDCDLGPNTPCPYGIGKDDPCDDDKCPKCENWYWYNGAMVTTPMAINCGDADYYDDDTANFIAHAREDVPKLLEEREGLIWRLRESNKIAECNYQRGAANWRAIAEQFERERDNWRKWCEIFELKLTDKRGVDDGNDTAAR